MTFSIVAWDPEASEWGVAVASKYLAAGAVVPWARAGVGAVATQAWVNISFGPSGLELLSGGAAAISALAELLAEDDRPAVRQVGIVDGSGRAAAHTGAECLDWAGHVLGDGYTCQGNILAGPEVLQRMAGTFESTGGELAGRLLAALAAGDEAGGDRRGRQSAGLLVVRAGLAESQGTDVAVDLRVDDHPHPVTELGRILDVDRLLHPRPDDLHFEPVDAALADEIRRLLAHRGFVVDGSGYDEGLRSTLERWVGIENLEYRWSDDAVIERRVLEALRS